MIQHGFQRGSRHARRLSKLNCFTMAATMRSSPEDRSLDEYGVTRPYVMNHGGRGCPHVGKTPSRPHSRRGCGHQGPSSTANTASISNRAAARPTSSWDASACP